eukprot:g4658.t1
MAHADGKRPFFPQGGGIAERVFVFFDDANGSTGGRITAILVMLTIFFSTTAFVVETVPELRDDNPACAPGVNMTATDCEPVSRPEFYSMEVVCIIIFTVDYLARMFTVAFVRSAATAGVRAKGPAQEPAGLRLVLRYALQPLNVIDFVAIAPFYIESALGGGGGQTAVIRVLRLARVLRIFKMGKHNKGMQMLAKVMVMSTPALSILVFFSVLCVVLFGSLMFFAEGSRFSVAAEFTANTSVPQFPHGVFVREGVDGYTDEPSPFISIPFAFWWVCTTMTTVGYGDFYPTTSAGKIIGILLFYIGIILIALPITILGMNFELVYNEELAKERERHDAARQAKKDDQVEQQRQRRSSIGEAAREAALRELQPTPWLPPPRKTLRDTVFHTLEEPSSCHLGKFISVAVMAAIVVSTVSFVMESMPQFASVPQRCLDG